MGTLNCRGYVPLSVAKLRNVGKAGSDCLQVILKTACDNREEDAELWQIIGIPSGEAARISLSMALAEIAEQPFRKNSS